MSPLVQVGVGCTLALLQTDIEATEAGWLEALTIDVEAASAECTQMTLPLPAGVHVVQAEGQERLADGIRRRLPEVAFQLHPRSVRDDGALVVHLPGLLAGDVARIEVQRRWSRPDPYVWRPDGARHAELFADEGLTLDPSEGIRQDKKGLWVPDATSEQFVTVTAPGRPDTWTAPEAHLLPAAPPTVTRRWTLLVPERDPQRAVYPGGGSELKQEITLGFQPADEDRGYVVPLPKGHRERSIRVTPSMDAVEWRERGDDLLLVIRATEARPKVHLQWIEPDAPTFGEPDPDETFEISAPGGKLITDRNGAWFLAGIHERPIIPARSALVTALERRYMGTAMPEPGLPQELRGRSTDWSLATDIVDTLHGRTPVATWPDDPLWPRRLIKARKSGGLSETEFALTAWLWLRQAQFQADWVLVRPAEQGPGGDASLAGYVEMLIRVQWNGETRWLDPACQTCGPFEVRPSLLDADALGRDVKRTPALPEGRWTAVEGDGWIRWELTGPPALLLREWIQTLPSEDAWSLLARRMAGPGSELVEVNGFDEPGAPIVVAARIGSGGVRTDPLSLPASPDGGQAWSPWVGTRTLVHATSTGRAAQAASWDGLSYESREMDGRTVETVKVQSRAIPTESRAALDRLRLTPSQDESDRPVDAAGEESEPAEAEGSDQNEAGTEP